MTTSRSGTKEHEMYPVFQALLYYDYTVPEGSWLVEEGRAHAGDRERDSLFYSDLMYREEPRWSDVSRDVGLRWLYRLYNGSRWGTPPLYAFDPAVAYWSITYKGRQEWCLGWFDHWTFDRGQSNLEVLRSFEEYVERVERHNRSHPTIESGSIELMGAEDRWRWRGTKDGDPREETPPPCRCRHCQAQGVIRIGH